MEKTLKKQVVEEIKEKLGNSKVIILTDYKGLNVAQITKLRKKLRKIDAEYVVFKNTLTGIAAKEKSISGIEGLLTGPTAILFGYKDPVMPAKILSEFIKENEKPSIKGGFFDGNMVDTKMIIALAKLPSREVLLAKVAGGFQAPIYNFVSDLQGIIRKFVYAVNAIKDKKAKQG